MRTFTLLTLAVIATSTAAQAAPTSAWGPTGVGWREAPGAYPRSFSPSINARQHRQSLRIHQGVGSGELTPWERHRLVRTEREIRQDEWAAKRDGELTPRERLKLQRELNHSSRQIYRLKHNCADR